MARLAATGAGHGSAREAPNVVLYEDVARKRVQGFAGALRGLHRIQQAMKLFQGEGLAGVAGQLWLVGLPLYVVHLFRFACLLAVWSFGSGGCTVCSRRGSSSREGRAGLAFLLLFRSRAPLPLLNGTHSHSSNSNFYLSK